MLFAHLVYGDCSKIKMIVLISYLRARRFQWFKMNGFSWWKSFVCRIVYSGGKKTTPIIDCITHLLRMTLRNVALTDVILFGLPMSSANLIFILSTICGTRAVEAFSCVQTSKKHFKIWLRPVTYISHCWDRQSRMRDYHLSLHALGKV